MRRLIGTLLLMALAACAAPKLAEPAERQQAQLARQAAVLAGSAGNWSVAQRNWQEAARRYASLDDWQAAGEAVVGQAQALQRLGRSGEAVASLQALLAQPSCPAGVRADAHYQLALLAADGQDAATAMRHLDAAADGAADPALQVALLNLRARLAAERSDWPDVRRLAEQALARTAPGHGEYANAQRLLGEAAMQTEDWPAAESALTLALAQDRAQARSLAIALDLHLLAELAARRGDPAAANLLARARAVCEAVRDLSEKAVCGYNRGLPRSGK